MVTKLLFIDVETTGLALPAAGLVQLAALVEIDGVEQERFCFNIQPFAGDVIEDEALEVNGFSRQDLAGFLPPREAFAAFLTRLRKYIDPYDRTDKFHFVAYNALFDASHVRAWFEKNGDRFFGSWFWHPSIDVMTLAGEHFVKSRHTLANFRLATVAEALGLTLDGHQAHDAMHDVVLMRAVYHKLHSGNGGNAEARPAAA